MVAETVFSSERGCQGTRGEKCDPGVRGIVESLPLTPLQALDRRLRDYRCKADECAKEISVIEENLSATRTRRRHISEAIAELELAVQKLKD